MAKGKGYKLTSASSDGGPKVCAFFASDKGCKSGAACKFVHDVAAPSNAPKSSSGTESSSVVSSESDGSDGEIDEGRAGAYASLARDELDQRNNSSSSAVAAQRSSVFSANNPFISGSVAAANEVAVTSAPTTSTAVAATTTESKKKEKKRKSSNNPKPIPELAPGETPFALSGPVGIPAVVASTSVITTATLPPAKKQKQKHQQQTTLSPPAIASFRDLKLPIAPFAVLATTTNILPNSPMIQQLSAPSSSTPAPPRQRPLPVATPAHLRWKDAVLSTRKHSNYSTLFDRPARSNNNDNNNSNMEGLISTRPYDIKRCSTNPASIAIDCEMCETRDPITGKVDTKALCRLSIVDADTPDGPVLLDTLVKPKWPVVDYRTWINGISADSLVNVEFTLDHAQAFMDALCSDQTVIVGHAVHNDLAALKLDHGCVVDTAMLYSHAAVIDESNAEGSCGGLTPSLRNLAHGVLGGRVMPEVHDSVNDARVALACAQYYVDMGGKVNTIDKVYKRSDRPNNNSCSTPGGGRNGSDQQHTAILLVHRLPINTLPEHLSEMFLAYSSIRPRSVPDIAYTGVHGKCHVEFTSAAHAELAYSTLVGDERADKTGKMQKRVGLKGGGYVCVRKMKKENNNKGGTTTPQK